MNLSKFSISILLVTVSIGLRAQTTEINFQDTTSVDDMNSAFYKNEFPFLITKSDSDTFILEMECESIGHCPHIRFYDNLMAVSKVISEDGAFYFCFLYAYTGYDYFYVIKERDMTIYMSSKYNYEQDSAYHINISSIDFSKNTVDLIIEKNNSIQTINFNMVDN